MFQVLGAVLLLLVVQINFGILPVAQKTVLTTLTPWSLFALRSIAGAISFNVLYQVWILWRRPPLVRAEAIVPVRVFLGLSFLGISANQFLLIIALTLTSSIAAVIIVPSITLFTFTFAVCLGRERFSWTQAGILLLGGGGVLILFADSLHEMLAGIDRQGFYGNLLCLISAAVYALYLVLSRDWTVKLPALQFTSRLFAYASLWSVLFLGIGYLFVGPGYGQALSFFMHAAPQVLAGTGLAPHRSLVAATLVFIVLGPTVLNYFLNFWVLRTLPASTVSGFISLQTLIGAAVSHLVLHEPMKPSYGAAAACILLSIACLSWQALRRAPQQPRSCRS